MPVTVWSSYRKYHPDHTIISSKGMDLKDVLQELERFAPSSLAESWDNVGLLVEPSPPHCVQTMFLTNDLTEDVLNEAINKNADLIVSYHPPIFVPLKKLTMATAKERIVVRAIEKKIAIFSPHTSYDAVEGGVNDWLAKALVPCSVTPLKTSTTTPVCGWTYRLEYQETGEDRVSIPSNIGTTASAVTKIQTTNGYLCTMSCSEQALSLISKAIDDVPEIQKTLQVTKLEKLSIPHAGTGRMSKLDRPVSIATVVQSVKSHLGLRHVLLALGSKKSLDSEVQTVAICAGSGASVLSGVPADIYLTGEMSHHDILAAVARGTSVILCNHSNTERGYLLVLKSKLDQIFDGKVDIVISELDADPLTFV